MNPLRKPLQWLQGPARWGAAVVYPPSTDTLGRVLVAHSTIHELPAGSPAPGARGSWALWLEDGVVHTSTSTMQRLVGSPSPYGRDDPPPLVSFAHAVAWSRAGASATGPSPPAVAVAGMVVTVRRDTLDIPVTFTPLLAEDGGMSGEEAYRLASHDLCRRCQPAYPSLRGVAGRSPWAVLAFAALAAFASRVAWVGAGASFLLALVAAVLVLALLIDRLNERARRRSAGGRLVLDPADLPSVIAAVR